MKFRRMPRRRTSAVGDVSTWVPRTEQGRRVKEKKITSIDEIFAEGKPVLESEIIDVLLPEMQQEMIQLSSTQRMTDSGRKAKYRAIVVLGDGKGYVSVGQGKADEARPALETAIKEAKRKVIKVNLGCGSWECVCGLKHSVPIKASGAYGGVRVTLSPAPRGTGIVANETVRTVLQLSGIKDVWTKAEGRTKNVYNTAKAVVDAIDSLNRVRIKREWS